MSKRLYKLSLISLSIFISSFIGINFYNSKTIEKTNIDKQVNNEIYSYPTSPSTNCGGLGTDLYWDLYNVVDPGYSQILGANPIFYNEQTETWNAEYNYFYISSDSTIAEYIEFMEEVVAYVFNTNWQRGDSEFNDMNQNVNGDDFTVTLFSSFQAWDSDGQYIGSPDETNDITIDYYDEKISYFSRENYSEEYNVYFLSFQFQTLIIPTTSGEAKGFCNYTYSVDWVSAYPSIIQIYVPYELNNHNLYIEEYVKVNFLLDKEKTYTLDNVNETLEQYVYDYFDYINVTYLEAAQKYNTPYLTQQQIAQLQISNFAPSSYYDLTISYSIPMDTVIWDPISNTEPVKFQMTITNNNDVATGSTTIDVQPSFIGYTPIDPETISNSHLPLIISTSVVGIIAVVSITTLVFYKYKNKEKDSNVVEKE